MTRRWLLIGLLLALVVSFSVSSITLARTPVPNTLSGLALRATATPTDEQRMVDFNRTGLKLLHTGRYAESVTAFEKALAIARQLKDAEAEGVVLYNMGDVYWAQGQYAPALDYYTQALTVARKIDDQAGASRSLNRIGDVYWIWGQYDKALDYLNQALTIRRETGDREGEGVTLNDIGVIYQSQGEYDKALDYLNQALTVRREIGDRAGEGTTLHNIGGVYQAKGQYDRALDFYNRALVIRREVGDREGEGATLNDIGAIRKEQGQYTKALDLYTQALSIAREVGDRPGEGTILNNIGGVYDAQGRYAKALDFYTQALTIARKIGDRAGEASALVNIGAVHLEQGQSAQALDYYTQSLTIAREIGDQESEGLALNNIGMIYQSQGQSAKALDFYNQSLAIKRKIGDRAGEGTTLNNIGSIYRRQDELDKALDYYLQALAIAREMGNRASEARDLNNIGGVYHDRRDYDAALDYYQQALVIERAIGDRVREASTLNNIGGIHRLQGQYAQALDYYNQALTIWRAVGDRANQIITLGNRGIDYEILKQRARAIADYRASVELVESVMDDAALDSAIASLTSQAQNSDPYQRLAVLLAQDGNLKDALGYAERGRAILIRTELSGKPIDFRAGLDQSLLKREADLRTALDSAQKTLDSLSKDASASAADVRNAQTALDKTRKDYDQYLETMQLKGGFLARQISHEVASPKQIQAALPADTTLVLYTIGHPDSIVFLITSKTLEAVALDVTDRQIEEQVTAFASDRRANAGTLAKLYNLVVAPIADKLKTKRLIIAPDGALNYVPFAALKGDSGRSLIDDYAISMVPSATTLVLLKARKPEGSATSPGLVLAQPSAPGLPRLTNVRTEAASVAKLLGVEPILDATETDLRSKVSGSKVLLIGAHAELDRLAPLFSVIYLKGDDRYDGRLEARKIYELDLSKGTELVVLSGCNTASGGNGEDFGVLTRAFFGAGAPRVVASLWSVDDEATAYLITTYMTERAAAGNTGNDADALRAAMLATREKYPEPYFWASFVLTGLP
jgi:tetratricopeptide (TPR) repeat protein